MPKKVHDCVQNMLSDEDFYPGNPDRESIAWGICYKNESVGNISDANTLTFTMTDRSGDIVIMSSEEEGDILMFNSAILCHQGMNSNRDVVPDGEIANLADTIAGRPIDFEHDYSAIRGVFTAGREVTSNDVPALSVDGIIWADRFDQSASEIRDGSMKLSVEADAKSAECSICGGIFTKSTEYCEHLMAKRLTGASRTLRGLKAKGGALTRNPADSKAGFADSNIRMVAFHQEASEEEDINMSKELQDKIAELEAANTELASANSELEAQLAEMTKRLETVEASDEAKASDVERLTASVESLEAEVKEERDRAYKLLEKVRRQALSASISDKEWEEKREAVMRMDEEGFALLANVASSPSDRREPMNVDLESGDKDPDPDGPVVWEV